MLAVRTRLATLPTGLSWRDLFAVSVLTGCGFTVSLLIAELAFGDSRRGGPDQDRRARRIPDRLARSAAFALRRRARDRAAAVPT